MTVKELKHMLENADDNAIVVVRNNWAPAEFLNTSARKMVLVKTNLLSLISASLIPVSVAERSVLSSMLQF